GYLDRGTGLRFASGNSSFVTESVSASRDGAVIKASVEASVNKNTALSLGYGGLLSQNYQDNSVNAGITWNF
ncbi:autotransporter outer membrane beta-barrel domain-containing protein, partial [Rouxiella sp. Mn2063]